MLFIDIGNTCLKWIESNEINLSEIHYIVHQQDTFINVLRDEWRLLLRPSEVKIACVSSSDIKEKVECLIESLWTGILVSNTMTQQVFKGLKNGYKIPGRLGVDRWLAMVGAYMEYSLPVCVVDCGTAITVDVIDVNGQHLGGMIMPGLKLMQQSLVKGTAQLNFSDNNYKQGLANDTDSAIYNGQLYAIKGFIDKGLIDGATLILTGGDAELIAAYCDVDILIDKNLVMKGLLA